MLRVRDDQSLANQCAEAGRPLRPLRARGELEDLGRLYKDVSRWIFTGAFALFLVIVGWRGAAPGGDAGVAALLAASLALHLAIVLFGEVGVTHATRDAQRAARALRKGALRTWFLGAIGLGSAAALLALGAALAGSPATQTAALFSGALVALAALWIWEHAWLRAGQCVPLS